MPTAVDPALESTRGELGRGVYALSDLRAFVALGGSSEDGEHVLMWLRKVLNPVPHRTRRADYSFSDLISLFVVRELLRKGVKPRKIKIAETYMRGQLGIDRPFVFEDIKTDGREVFYRDEAIPTQIESASEHGQQRLREAIRDKLTSVRYDDGTAACWLPSSDVVVDPRVQFGSPVVRGTGVPTSAVYGVAKQLGFERASLRFDLPQALVESAIAFEDRIRNT